MCFIADDCPSLYESDVRTARTPRSCCECDQAVEPGQQYLDVRGIWDGEFIAFPTCRRCQFLRVEIFKIEQAEGCHVSESWCPHAGLQESLQYIDELEMIPADEVPAEFDMKADQR